MPLFSQPPAPQQQDIDKTIIIVVRLDHVERADLAIHQLAACILCRGTGMVQR